jgi:hypothetical protein
MKGTKHGFIVTYFKTCKEAEVLLKNLLEVVSKQNFYVILASHTADVPLEIQKLCDFYFYEELNVVDNRNCSHGVAENNLIAICLLHLKYKNIEWTYKVSYDVVINDIQKFYEWQQDYKYKFVSCNWGDIFLCTNSFFANVNFIIENINFYDSIEQMFSVNTLLEKCWEQDIETKDLKKDIFTYKNKSEFFGVNSIDNLYYDYNKIQFWFEPEKNLFFIINNGSDFRGEIKIFDYYTDLCLYYSDDFTHTTGVQMWISPPYSHILKNSKNGFYLEMYKDDITVRLNWGVRDFSYKDPMHKSLLTFKNEKDQCRKRIFVTMA